MEALIGSKQKIRLAIIDFKDKCDTLGQNGIVSAAIADEIKESLTKEQISYLIYHLSK